MKFSMARMMAVMGFVCVVLAAAFAMPSSIGLFLLTLISLIFLPAFIWVGALNTRGRKQAFFVGAIISGVPHFVVSAYYCVALTQYMSWEAIFDSDGEGFIVNVVHLIGITIGCLGGVSGVFAHWFIVPLDKRAKVNSGALTSAQTDPFFPGENGDIALPDATDFRVSPK